MANQQTTYGRLLEILNTRGAGYLVLLDPDKQTPDELAKVASRCESEDVDGFLIGGSLMLNTAFDEAVSAVKKATTRPVILFPGSGQQLSAYADAVLFMTIISGRNPHTLIGEQVQAAPIVRALRLEPIPMGYMLVESGRTTAAEFMSNTRPLPRHKPEIAVAHALAGEYLGLRMIYLEAGSGALESVPEAMIGAVAHTISIPLIVGGGIRTPEDAFSKVEAGAGFVVTGTVIEDAGKRSPAGDIARAVHEAGRKRIQ